jgi:hypothetical protein
MNSDFQRTGKCVVYCSPKRSFFVRPPVARIKDYNICIPVPRESPVDNIKSEGFPGTFSMSDWHLPFLDKEGGAEELHAAIVILNNRKFAH